MSERYQPRPRRYVMAFMAGLSSLARMSSELYMIELVTAVSLDALSYEKGQN